MYKFKFADIGEGLHEGVVAEIYKKEGDIVKEGDPLFSVETDKVTSDIPSPADGTISTMIITEGDTVHVGDVIYNIDDGSSNTEEPVAQETAPEKPAEPVVETTEEVIEKAPSVVGDLEQSNDILDFSKFGTKAPATVAPKTTSDNAVNSSNTTYDTDLIVIGSGPGGYLAAEIAGKNNLKTIIIEMDSPGGVCLNIGCIPTKTLLHSAKQLHYLKTNKEMGLEIDLNNLKINWKAIIARKQSVVKMLVGGVTGLLKAPNITLIKGYGKIINKNTVEVNGKECKTKNIIIATGSSPIKLPLNGFDKARKDNILIDSTQALDLSEIPKSLVVIGGGVIGLEFATLYNEFGTKVTIIEGLSSLVAFCDKEISAKATQIAKDNGISVITNAKVIGFENGAVQYELNGKVSSIQCDKILESVGRKPNIDAIGNIGIKLGNKKEIVVNDELRTSIPNILAIGDVIGHAMLAHAAYRHAKLAINTILNVKDKYNQNHMPASIYTYPEISTIGKTEEQLKEEKIDYLKVNIPNMMLGKALADGTTLGFTKLLFGKQYGEILGCHMINSHSSDIVAEIAVVMELEGTIFDINKAVHPHPSISETLSEAALQAVFTWQKANKTTK